MSETENRRKEICRLLQHSTVALNGTELAKMFGVSRQVIVQDIIILFLQIEGIFFLKLGKHNLRRFYVFLIRMLK